MSEQRQSGIIGGVSRVLAAAYLGTLLAGPAPLGFSSIFLGENNLLAGKLMLAAVMIIPWLIAGLAAGRRLGIYAAVAGLLFWEWRPLTGGMAVLLLMVIPLPLVSAWLGSRLSSRLRVTRSLDGWRYWRTAGIVVVMLAVYTSVAGPMIAGHTMKARFDKMWPARSPSVQAYAMGAYVAVDGLSSGHGGVPDTYYMDPSGLLFLYKANLD